MDKLSKEELLQILAKSEKPRKPRKKPDLDEEKKVAMLERLSVMREKVKENREAKKRAAEGSTAISKEKEIENVFEKKYGSHFEKMNDLLTDLNENTKETLRIKKEKASAKSLASLPVAKEIKMEITEKPAAAAAVSATTPAAAVHTFPAAAAAAPPPTQLSRTHPVPSPAPIYNPHQYALPNRPVFAKGRTRF
jgi:hypothetical protein